MFLFSYKIQNAPSRKITFLQNFCHSNDSFFFCFCFSENHFQEGKFIFQYGWGASFLSQGPAMGVIGCGGGGRGFQIKSWDVCLKKTELLQKPFLANNLKKYKNAKTNKDSNLFESRNYLADDFMSLSKYTIFLFILNFGIEDVFI